MSNTSSDKTKLPDRQPRNVSNVLGDGGSSVKDRKTQKVAFRAAGSSGSSGPSDTERVHTVGFPDEIEKRIDKSSKFSQRALANLGFETVDPGTDPRHATEGGSLLKQNASRTLFDCANTSDPGTETPLSDIKVDSARAPTTNKMIGKHNFFKRMSEKIKKGRTYADSTRSTHGHSEAKSFTTVGAAGGEIYGDHGGEADEITPVVTGEGESDTNEATRGCFSAMLSRLCK